MEQAPAPLKKIENPSGIQWPEATKLFNSEKFIKSVNEFTEDKRDKVIGEMLEYISLFDGLGDADDFLNEFKTIDVSEDKEINTLLVNRVAKRLKVEDPNSIEGKKILYDYFNNAIENEGYYFHGFNGAFEDDIAKHGLHTTKRNWDPAELSLIEAIGEKRHQKFLGWGAENKIFAADTALHAYKYAVASPEWFSQFVAGVTHIPAEGTKKEAFYLRDYNQAKQNILDLCHEMTSAKEEDIAKDKAWPNITEQEKDQIIHFFEKYWALLAGAKSGPKVALIKHSFFDGKKNDITLEEFAKIIEKKIENVDMAYILGLMRGKSINFSKKVDIPPDQIRIIGLPEYKSIHPELV